MKIRVLKKLISVVALSLAANASQAALISEITHDYGVATTKIAPISGLNHFGGTSCNTLQSDSITVTDTTSSNGCNRFYDSFDLSVLNYDAIDSFTLSLTFSDTNDRFIIFPEDWRVMAASSGDNADTVNNQDINRSGGVTTQDFYFDTNNISIFNDILTSNEFGFWLGDEGFGANNFDLHSATLKIEGVEASVAVPEPSIFALLGLGLIFMGGSRLRQK